MGYAGYPYAYSGLYHGYAGYHAGYPYAYYGKRSADAEPEAKADPWVTYGAYGAYPYAYSGLHYGYAGYPYAYHYGKRSADGRARGRCRCFLRILRLCQALWLRIQIRRLQRLLLGISSWQYKAKAQQREHHSLLI